MMQKMKRTSVVMSEKIARVDIFLPWISALSQDHHERNVGSGTTMLTVWSMNVCGAMKGGRRPIARPSLSRGLAAALRKVAPFGQRGRRS